jgi:AcrR family transcriptional regulator
MPRSKSPDYDAQRDAILERATGAFAELGYASASMAQVARACGTSKARLYHYFPSKDAILFESLDRYTQRLGRCVEAVRSRGLAPRTELAELVRVLVTEYRDSRAWHIALLNDVKFLPAVHRERIKAQQRVVVDAIADTVERVAPGRFPAAQRKPVTMALLGMINFTFAWMRPDGPMSHERYAELVARLWLQALDAPVAPTAPTTTFATIEPDTGAAPVRTRLRSV